ncbi:lysine methyltransferase [Nitzschia inconspicua]|uniref:Lysine methyltransferase n=1 Tax=Nitzschia inconspicua TaxID=303405 RepID=A0A9K3LMD5_9STRA|nr:lysine methyltransferase [Nitzschia inconspicua]
MNHDQEEDDNKAAEIVVVEEDWSDFLGTNTTNHNDGFARHDTVQEVSLPVIQGNKKSMVTLRIASVSSLSPMDMVNLSWGTHDATGHRIWLGATLLVQALPILTTYLASRRILELGAGTGLAGIAVAKTVEIQELILTDASLSALELCRNNCENNQVGEHVQVKKLCWGDTPDDASGMKKFDTVMAADILYDLNMLQPIFQTACRSLKMDGIMILSHVPRAAVSIEDAPKGKSIEDIILDQAAHFGFDLKSILHPTDIPSMDEEEQDDMQQKGVAIFIWKYKGTH